ncbi:transposase [Bradyrhizobium sp. CB82]|uniref:IS66 family transposase n=1 Tax=Bradyrhizobium sp. CB82 TaxID=3039159 RepID=UPI0032C21DF7
MIESALPTESCIAQIAVVKYADWLPLHRRQAICTRDGVDLERRCRHGCQGRVRIAANGRLCAGEDQGPTRRRCLGMWRDAEDLAVGPGAGRSAFGGSGPPMVAYRFEDRRVGEWVERRGLRHPASRGYAAYNRLARSPRQICGLTLVACFAHVRLQTAK